MSDDNLGLKLHSTMDAKIWAEEFMKLQGGKLNEIDEELMIAWFANSIMVGWDTAHQRMTENE